MIEFKTRRIKSKLTEDSTNAKYRGFIAAEGGVVEADEVFGEVARRTKMSEADLRHVVDSYFRTVRDLILQDGRSRRVSDWLLLDLRLCGSFGEADEGFADGRHELKIGARTLGGFRHLEKRLSVRNEKARTRGRAESLMNPGGDAGTLVFGSDILLKGHDFTWDGVHQILEFHWQAKDGRKTAVSIHVGEWVQHDYRMIDPDSVVEADSSHVVFKWPASVPKSVIGSRISVHYVNYESERVRDPVGSAAYADVVAQ